ncbi:MAG: site-specific integrase [Gemmataceae bacterium]|nr:site-specific integrase [Gemmataceae bacterium]
MTERNSTAPRRRRKPVKPKKPDKTYPLFAHNNGQWCKKVRQKLHFFGVWADPQNALERWLDEKDDLLAGRVPRSRHLDDAPALRDLVNQFLTTKSALRENGELSIHTWNAYHDICERVVEAFGRDRLLTDLLPEDFEHLRTRWARTWGPVRLGSEINRTRVVFNYAYKNGLIDKPMRFGEGFRRPSQKTLRLARAEKGPKMFEADELRRMIDSAGVPMRAMLLLAINAALGNNDVAQLPTTALDHERGWLTFPRPKTGIMRRCPLWPVTVQALRDWLTQRPAPKKPEDADLVFLTKRGNGWSKNAADRPVTHECRKLLDRLEIKGSRNFYAIRHTFETIGGESRDQVAVDAIMGHVDASMAAHYRERISDERLLAVTEHVRRWLFAVGDKKRAKKQVANRS